MSAATYRAAVVLYRDALDVLRRDTGQCGLCGHADARHRVAEAIAERLAAGEGALSVADDYEVTPEAALSVAFYAVAADARRHGLTRGRAADVDREVWADS